MSRVTGPSGPPVPQTPRTPNQRDNPASNNAGFPMNAGDAVKQTVDATSPPVPAGDKAEFQSRQQFNNQMDQMQEMKDESHMGPRGMKEPGESAAQHGVTAHQVQMGVAERSRRINHAECQRNAALADVRLKNKNTEVNRLEKQVKIDEENVGKSQAKLNETTDKLEDLRKQKNEGSAQNQEKIRAGIWANEQQQKRDNEALTKYQKKLADDQTLLATAREEQEQLRKEKENADYVHEMSHRR